MSFLKKLFGGGADTKPKAAPIEYNGFRITPDPAPEQGQFRIGALIEKEVGGEIKTHHLIRADILRDMKEAQDASVNKAKQLIDQMGDRLFG